MRLNLSFSSKLALYVLAIALLLPASAHGEVTRKQVLDSIDRGKRALKRLQSADGAWRTFGSGTHVVGVTSLAMLALLNSDEPIDAPEVALGLKFLRSIRDPEPRHTYEVSLLIMALAAAKDRPRDSLHIARLVKRLEDWQIKRDANAGTWDYGAGAGGGDRSNGQFAVLGLREAHEAGVPVSHSTWRLAREHWERYQGIDGGWSYTGNNLAGSTGSMSVAGISTMHITGQMLRDDKDLQADGAPDCCAAPERDEPLEKGIRWLEENFAIAHNPGGQTWLLYYLYGLERAGRLTARRFFGKHDWYREGADFIIRGQNQLDGTWRGPGLGENDPTVATSFALLFLSKGLAPVLINKLEHNQDDWNRHPNDIRNLTDLVSGLPKWPKLMTWQVINMAEAEVVDLAQAPILAISGGLEPTFDDAAVKRLREYLDNGGFIMAQASCQRVDFDLGFRNLVKRLYPEGIARLDRLPPEHPVFRAEYPIDPASVELWGVDVGCRTSIIYSPDDLGCLWDRWMRQDPPGRPAKLKGMITKATRVGVNIVAYATGREPLDKLEKQEQDLLQTEDQRIERGFLEVAKIVHTGGWDAAPQALRNLLAALNRTAGVMASNQPRKVAPLDPNLFKYPLLYMHGRHKFQLGRQEQERLRQYLDRGGVLFADACCSSQQFDAAFRELAGQLFTDRQMTRIPPDHELFRSTVGHNLQKVRRREVEVDNPDAALRSNVRTVEPYLEGIEQDGRYVLIYSKYDISCALERQAAASCPGYVHEDAVRLAVNVVLYALLQ